MRSQSWTRPSMHTRVCVCVFTGDMLLIVGTVRKVKQALIWVFVKLTPIFQNRI